LGFLQEPRSTAMSFQCIFWKCNKTLMRYAKEPLIWRMQLQSIIYAASSGSDLCNKWQRFGVFRLEMLRVNSQSRIVSLEWSLLEGNYSWWRQLLKLSVSCLFCS
jgi:hypothetical protein